MVRKKDSTLLILLILFSIALFYMYNSIKQTRDEIYSKLETNEIAHIANVMSNIYDNIKSKYAIDNKDALLELLKDDEKRERYEKLLSFYVTDNIKYFYLLYRDNEGKFRFLLDASKDDKARFYQKFDVDSDVYSRVYTLKEPQIIRQKDMQNLYITYVSPLLSSSNEVVGVYSIDITTATQDMILSAMEPLENFFKILIVIVLVLMIIALVEFFNHFSMKKRVFVDSLTQIFNRNYLKEICGVLNLKNYAVAMLDLDKFKYINDTYGHQAGDLVLVEVSKIFKNSIRDNDMLIRYGGEEFLLLINLRDKNFLALDICERIRQNIASHKVVYKDKIIDISVSIGLYVNVSSSEHTSEAIKKADIALYEAKRNGRNRVELYQADRFA